MVEGENAGAAAVATVPPAGGGEATAPEEKDWKAEYEALKAVHDKDAEELGKERQRARSAEGRLKSAQSPEAFTRLETEVKRIRREIRRDRIDEQDIEPAEKARRLTELEQEEVADREASVFQRHSTRRTEQAARRLARAGISVEHPKVQEFALQWGRAMSRDEVDQVYEEMLDFIEEERETQRLKTEKDKKDQEEKTRKESNAARQTLAVGAQGGTPIANTSEQAWLDEYGDEVTGRIPPSPANAARAQALIAKGLRPRIRTG